MSFLSNAVEEEPKSDQVRRPYAVQNGKECTHRPRRAFWPLLSCFQRSKTAAEILKLHLQSCMKKQQILLLKQDAKAIANDWQCEEITCVAMNVPWHKQTDAGSRLQIWDDGMRNRLE